MNLYLFDENKIVSFSLPVKVIGNFWMTNSFGKNIINIDAQDNNWIISGDDNTKIYFNGTVVPFSVLKPKN